MKPGPPASLPTQVDAVVIGSSPLMLRKALELAHAGLRVVVLERSHVLGGSWYAPPMLGFESVEAGVHLIENRPIVYEHLEELGVALSDPDRLCLGFWRSLRMPLPLARAISFAGVLAKSAVVRDREKFATTLPRLVRSLASLFVPFRYPAAGARGMVLALADGLAAAGMEPILCCEIEEVLLEPGVSGGRCRTRMGVVEFETLCFSSRAHCPIRLGDAELNIPYETREICSVIVCVESEDVRAFSYAEIVSDHTVRRARDVTQYVFPSPSPTETVLCIELRDSEALRGQPAEALAKVAMSRLADYGLVSRGPRVLRARADRFTYHTVPDNALGELASKHEALVGVKTTDFAEDLVGTLRPRSRVAK